MKVMKITSKQLILMQRLFNTFLYAEPQQTITTVATTRQANRRNGSREAYTDLTFGIMFTQAANFFSSKPLESDTK